MGAVDHPTSMRLPVPRLLLLAFAIVPVLLVPTSAMAKSTKRTYPVIKKVTPLKITIGSQLTIKGANFNAGKGQNSVVFKRDGKPAVFVKSGLSTKKKIYVTVPDKLAAFLGADGDGTAVPTRFRLRVLAGRFSKSFTSTKMSPLIKPRSGSSSGPAGNYTECQTAAKTNPNADGDADGLTNGTELAYGIDPCTADTDHDGMVDGYEFYSSKDLNVAALPYPGTRPWPNPLDGTDGGYDFDGDGLTLSEEYRLWKAVSGTFPLTAYSDGTQQTGGVVSTSTPALQALDLDGDGMLTDDERDADGDGLSNVVEFKYRGTVDWWTKALTNEKPYTWTTFKELDPTVADTDGDGVLDGADDQDHDDYDNYTEMERSRPQVHLRVQPYNPCLPNPQSRSCGRYVPFDNPWPPFDGSQSVGDEMPFIYPRPSPASGLNPWDGTGGP
jgi:IPT/TIG domain